MIKEFAVMHPGFRNMHKVGKGLTVFMNLSPGLGEKIENYHKKLRSDKDPYILQSRN